NTGGGGAAGVNLRGILIDGVGAGATGIINNSALTYVHITDCVIRNFTGAGIVFSPAASNTMFVGDTLIADNGGAGLSITLASTFALLSNVELINNASGVALADTGGPTGTMKAIIHDSVIKGNSGDGVSSTSITSTLQVMIIDSAISNNGGSGISVSGAGATTNMTRSTVTGNGTGLTALGGTLNSYGDNNVDG